MFQERHPARGYDFQLFQCHAFTNLHITALVLLNSDSNSETQNAVPI